jgi:ATP-binding cassette subfamily F protein 3
MLLHPANFLLLDEPTNHLDIRAKDILLNALSAYTGTVVFVSHDRYFIDKLATRVFEIGGGKVEVYPGNYEDFLWRKQGGAAKLQESVVTSTQKTAAANGNGHAPKVVESKAKRINPIKRKHMEERFKKLEEEISSLESAIGAYESSLQSFVSAEETTRLKQELDQSRTELHQRTAEWEELGQELEATNDKI